MTPSRPARRISARRLSVLLPLAGAGLLVVLFRELGPAEILALLERIGANFAVLLGIFIAVETARAMALSRCLRAQHRVPLWRLTWLQCLGEAVRTLTHAGPLVAEPARGWMLARQGLQGAHAYAAVISELLANACVSGLVTMCVLGFALVTNDLGPQLTVLVQVLMWASAGFVLVVVIGLWGRVHVIGAMLGGAARLPLIGRRLTSDPHHVRHMEDAIIHVLRDRPVTLAQVVALELVAQALLVLETWWTFRAMGLPVSLGRTVLVETLTKIPNFIQLIGATEGAYAVVFDWLGLTATVGFALSLVKRVRSLAIAALSLALLARLDRSRWSLAAASSEAPPP